MNEITLIFLLTLFLLSNANANDSCSDPNYMSGRRNITISVNGLERLFELYIPFRARSDCGEYCTGPPSKPTRGLVLNWHGCNAHQPILEYHTEISKVTEEAMTRSYYTITPLGEYMCVQCICVCNVCVCVPILLYYYSTWCVYVCMYVCVCICVCVWL